MILYHIERHPQPPLSGVCTLSKVLWSRDGPVDTATLVFSWLSYN